MHIPRQRESTNDVHTCLADPDCPELAAFRITREDRLGKRSTYACAFHLGQAKYAVQQRFPGEPCVTVTLAIPDRARGR